MSRRRLGDGGWMSLGFLGRGTGAILPAGVSSIGGLLHTITPGITVLALTCHLDETTAASIDAMLRLDWETIAVPWGNSYEIVEPAFGKRRKAAEIRKEVHESIGAWVGEQLPGALLQSRSNHGLSIDLLLTDDARPFHPAEQDKAWLSVLGMSHDVHSWRWEALSASLMLEQPVDSRTTSPIVLAGRRVEVRGDLHDDELVNALTFEHVQPLLTLLVLDTLIQRMGERLGDLRDDVSGEGSAPDRLKSVSRSLFPFSSDLRAVVADSERWAEVSTDRVPTLVRQDARNRPDGGDYPDLNLTQLMLEGVVGAAAQLREAEAQLRDGLVIATNLEATAADLKLQRGVATLAAIAAVAAVLSLVFN